MARGRLTAAVLLAVTATLSFAASGSCAAIGNGQMIGAAHHIAFGGGKLWVIGIDPHYNDAAPHEFLGYGIYRWNEGTQNWDTMPGAAERIAVASDGNAWVVNKQHQISRFNGNGVNPANGAAHDIGAGGGKVWAIGIDRRYDEASHEFLGYGIYRWSEDTQNWDRMPGAGIRIGVDSQGNAWVINKQHKIYHFNGSTFYQVDGPRAYGIGADTVPWIMGDPSIPPLGKTIYQWNGKGWDAIKFAGIAVAVRGTNEIYALNTQHKIYHIDVTPTPGNPIPGPGSGPVPNPAPDPNPVSISYGCRPVQPPVGWIVTNYFENLIITPTGPVSCPGSTLEFPIAQVEKYSGAPPNTQLNICLPVEMAPGESFPPSGWIEQGSYINLAICPREVEDNTVGPNNSHIVKLP